MFYFPPIYSINTYHMDMIRLGIASGLIELVRRDLHDGGEVAVVRVIDGYDVCVPGVGLGQSQRQIVRLRPRVDEVADGQVAGHQVGHPLGAGHQLIVQEPVVGGDDGHLFGARLNHLRVTVTDCRRV